ncbi:MAG: hypothetical protein ACK56F_06375, partial [bacterium]
SKDTRMLYFYAGAIALILVELIFHLVFPLENGKVNWLAFENNFPCFRVVLMTVFCLILISMDMKILRDFKINYPFIFELDPK